MRASINILQYEHGVIRQVTDVLGEMVRKRGYRQNREHLPQILEFMDEYVDSCHHTMEERFVFPLARKMSAEASADIDHLISEHREVRGAVREMTDILEGGLVDEERFHELARWLVEELEHHIQHEEDEVFPALEDHIDLDLDGEVTERMNDFVNSNFGEGFHGRYEEYSFRIQDDVLGPGFYEGVV